MITVRKFYIWHSRTTLLSVDCLLPGSNSACNISQGPWRVSSTGTGKIHVRSSRCWGPSVHCSGAEYQKATDKMTAEDEACSFGHLKLSPVTKYDFPLLPFPNLYAKIIFISFPSPPSPSELPFYTSCSDSCDQGFPALLLVELMLTNVKATFALVIIILSARVLVMLPIRRVYTQARNFYETLIQIQIREPGSKSKSWRRIQI